jgi:ribosomal protein S15P/S13E
MDKSLSAHHDIQPRADIINRLVDHLRQYPQDLVDAKRLLRYFRASANEFYQALLVIDQQPSPQSWG